MYVRPLHESFDFTIAVTPWFVWSLNSMVESGTKVQASLLQIQMRCYANYVPHPRTVLR